MKYLNNIATYACSAALALLTLTGCEGGELFSVGAPDWIGEKADSIANSKQGSNEEVIEGLQEDVYQIGASDFSNGFWSAFSKYYVIPDKEIWNAQFNLTVNPDNVYYKNFALVVTTDDNRGGASYSEFGVLRYDFTNDSIAFNSQWGGFPFKFSDSNLAFSPVDNVDAKAQQLNGRVTVTVDRSQDNVFFVKMTNGTATKTYTQPYAISPGSNIRCFITVDGSYINFLSSTIEPIGGFTSAEDKQPLSMVLKGVPRKVLLGTPLEDVMANVTAEVQFEQEVSATVTSADLQFQTIPDIYSLGTKTLVVVYNKTYKGENCDKPVIATVTFDVVEKMYTCVGATDNSTQFRGDHSEPIKVEPGETFVSRFTNYTNGGNGWNNFITVLTNEDGSLEYGVLRADNWGWGTGWVGEQLGEKCATSGGQTDGDAWLAAMDGAKVTVYVTNNGDGTCDVQSVMEGNDGMTYIQDYIGLNTVTDPDNFYFHFTVDGCHLEFDEAVGADDNSTLFWGDHSQQVQVPAGKTIVRRFKNYTNGANGWNNFITVLSSEDGSFEYGVLRADNWGWGTGWVGEQLGEKCATSGGQFDWAAWLAAMDGATVRVAVTNNGDGTCDVKCVMDGTDGMTYIQDYIGLNTVTDPDNVFARFTVDGCHLVFE